MRGIGVEAIRVEDFVGDVNRRGDALLTEFFTDQEREYCWVAKRSLVAFAGLKATKEALLKALPNLSREFDFSWRDLEVESSDSGQARFRLAGRLLEHLRRNGVSNVHLSMSSTPENAVAFVVVE